MSDNEKSPQADWQEGQEKIESKTLCFFISKKEDFVNIPNELKELPQWVCWKPEKRNEKLTKVPISPFSEQKASVNDPKSWNTFKKALNFAEARKNNGIAGIGFVFTGGDPYCGIDIDNCRDYETGKLTAFAQKIIEIMDSYTEISPSGKGIHIIFKGTLPGGGRKNPRRGIEVYDSKRYFIMTGNILDGGNQIQERQSELETVLAEHFKRPRAETNVGNQNQVTVIHNGLSDEEIIEKAMKAKNGDKFKLLWEGDWEGLGYDSHSEADAALIAMLAFYTGPDPERIDFLFRQSGLYRKKSERSDYRERTIQKVLDGYAQKNGTGNHIQAIDSLSRNVEDWEPNLKDWPKLGSKALLGVVGEFVTMATENSEADPAAVLITFLTRFGIECSPNPHIMVGDTKHYARLFVAVVGDTSKSRKGTSAQPVERLFSGLSSFFSLNSPNKIDIYTPANTSPGPLSSGEGLIYAVRNQLKTWDDKKGSYKITDPGIHDKRLFVLDQELASALQCTKREGNTLSTILRGFWDNGNAEPLTKTSKISTTGAHIGIVTHITTAELNRMLSVTELLSGFGNRFLWILAHRPKVVAMPRPMPDNDLERLGEKVGHLVKHAQGLSCIELSAHALEFWKGVYPILSKAHPGLTGAVINRAEAQVLRLALIYTLLDEKTVIDREHLESALAVWDYGETSARFIFDEREENPVNQKLLELLQNGPKSATEIYRSLSNNVTKKQLNIAINELRATRRVSVTKKPVSKGRPKMIFSINE